MKECSSCWYYLNMGGDYWYCQIFAGYYHKNNIPLFPDCSLFEANDYEAEEKLV